MATSSSKALAEKRIQEALSEAGGNTTQAQKILIGWAMRDHDLLLALVKPHITGITAHAVNRVAQGTTKPQSVGNPAQANKTEASKAPTSQPEKTTMKKKIPKDSIGMDILKTIAAGETAQFGQENYGRPLGKKGASQRHIDAIHQIIKSGASKK